MIIIFQKCKLHDPSKRTENLTTGASGFEEKCNLQQFKEIIGSLVQFCHLFLDILNKGDHTQVKKYVFIFFNHS